MEKFGEVLGRLRQLSGSRKNVLVWGITILLAVMLLIWWIPQAKSRLQLSGQESPSMEEQFRLEELQSELQNIPVEIPNMEHGQE